MQKEIPPISLRTASGHTPLSRAQWQVWFFDQLAPGSAAYNIPIAARMGGPLNVSILEQSLNEIIRRHDALRTTFPIVDGQPTQVVIPTLTLALSVIDLQVGPEAARENKVLHLAAQEARSPFDLAHGPLVRATLLHLGPQEHILLLTIHHIVADGWSIGVLFRELSTLYTSFSNGEPSPLPELPIQYSDYTLWQRQWVQGEVLEQHLAYWRQQLAGAPPMLLLPTDRPRPATQSFQGATQAFRVPERLTQALQALSQREGVTLFMTLLAAFQVLLSRYSGQEDIVVGTPIANRNRAEIENLIGFFVNMLVLRTDLSGNPRFCELLARVREVAFGAYAHQDLPFEKLVEELHPERDLSRNPLFQVAFIMQNTPLSNPELPGARVRSLEAIDKGTTKYDVMLSLEETEGGLAGMWQYNLDLFDAATIDRMKEHYLTLLESIVVNPGQRISTLPLLSPAQRQQLLGEWNATQTGYSQTVCIHELFETQVERTPDAIAMLYEERRVTYRELNRRANQLAHYLRRLGVGPEALVGICVERSPEILVGLLGILKAGGAYVPLDPAYPRERLTVMLQDAQVSVLLTQQYLKGILPRLEAQMVCLDTEQEGIAQEHAENPINLVTIDNLAYVLYTSGSTGRPKGVAVAHRNATSLLHWARETFSTKDLAGVLASTSICFDLSVFELFAPLSCGGMVVLARDVLQLPYLPAAQHITLINTVPSAITELLRANGILESVCTVNLAGEPLRGSLVQRLYQYGTVERVYNLYGPTEDTTYSTFALMPQDVPESPPIGRPIANTQVYLLDADLEPVPIGVPGELYIGGAGLARGYLHQPTLTAERFIPNPFSSEPGTRLYKTGDLACYSPTRDIEFLGRIDRQVKVRGFRIELEEIEVALSQHPCVREAIVQLYENEEGDKQLAAYIVPRLGSAPSPSELRHFLQERLPGYMIPSTFMLLEALPLTPNGKVNRRSLPTPDRAQHESDRAFIAPRTRDEELLAKLWCELLGRERVSVHDDFFELGGHSLLAVRLIAQIQKQFGQHIPLSALFQGKTIEALAIMLRRSPGARWQSPLVKIQSGGSRQPFFCVHPAGGNVLCYTELARHLGRGQPLYGLQVSNFDEGGGLYTKIENMATHYIEALRTIQPQGPYFLGGWSFGGCVAFEMALQLRREGHQVNLLALVDSWAPISSNKVVYDDTSLMNLFARNLVAGLSGENQVLDEELGSWTSDEHLHDLLRWSKKTKIIPPDIGPVQFRQLFQVFEINIQALLNYTPQIYPGCITLFRADEEPLESSGDLTKGWGNLTAGGVEMHTIPGNHYTILRTPQVAILAEKLNSCIDKAQSFS